MKISETITSKYFKCQDIPGHERGGSLVVQIEGFEEGVYEDGKPSLEMQLVGLGKSLGLNVTNRKRLMMLFGDVDTDALIGQQVELYAELTQDWQGNPCYGVRIRGVSQAPQVAAPTNSPGAMPAPPAGPAHAEEPVPPPTDGDNGFDAHDDSGF